MSIGTLHTVSVARKTLPFQLFYDIGGNIEVAQISFSPAYVYSLNDVLRAAGRLIPPIPSLYPIASVPSGVMAISNALPTLANTSAR